MSELRAWLDKLGHMSVEDIRQLMRDEGCKGHVGSSHRCVIAVFLTAQIGVTTWVGHSRTTTVKVIEDRDAVHESLETPDSVQTFITRFDCDQFPELTYA